MKFTINHLLNKNQKIFEYYQTAKTHWKEILDDIGFDNVDELAKRLFTDQLWFEHNCGGRTLGQEVMAISGIAQFYDIYVGFEDTFKKAQYVYEAFASSFCSLEVKYYARETAVEYDIIEGDKYEF